MNTPRKVCVVITARPSYSRIKTALVAIDRHPDLELQLVVAASALLERYGSAAKFIEDEGFKIAARVYMVLEGENPSAMAKTTGLGVLEMATVFDNPVVFSVAVTFSIPLRSRSKWMTTGFPEGKSARPSTRKSPIRVFSSGCELSP